jgi:hypothetical protein
VIINALLDFAHHVFAYTIGLLPQGHLSLPSPAGLADLLGGLDSMVPVLAVIQLALTVLAAVLVFFTVRLILVIWNLIWP